jgi:PAS domain S-box-containing protein
MLATEVAQVMPTDDRYRGGDAFASAFEHQPDPSLVVAAARTAPTIVFANAVARRLMLGTPGAPVGETLVAAFGGTTEQTAELDRALASREPRSLAWRGAATATVLALRLTPLPDTAEERDRTLVTWADPHHVPPFGKLADHIPDPVFVLDPASEPRLRIVYANRAAALAYGWSTEELLARSILDLDTPCTARHADDRLVRILAGEIVTFEGRHRRRDGSELPIEARACLVRWNDRPAILAIDRDLTARQRAADALVEANERLRLALASGRMGTWDWDIARNQIVWSPFHYELFGYPVGDPAVVTFAHFQQRVHPDDWLALVASIEAARTNRAEYHHLARVVRPDGSTRWFTGTGRFHYDQAGTAVRMLGVVHDETERYEAERTRQRLEDQLRHAQKLEAIGLLAGGVAHDFNNVLTAVMGFGDLIRDASADAATRGLAEEIKLAATRGAHLTRQLLAFSRKQVVRTELIDPATEVTTFLPMLRRLCDDRVPIDFEAGRVHGIQADRSQLQQVLMNLVVNARDAMPNGGRIRITLGPGQLDDGVDAVRLSVADTGTGMTDEVKAHLFEPFFTTKAPGKGTGLGLATAWGIVNQAGGRIEVDSTPDVGSTFHVLWPCSDARFDGSRPTTPRHDRMHVLVVEDDTANRTLATRILRHAGFHVQQAPDGESALVLAAKSDQIDVLLTDVLMPGMSGRQLAERMQQMRPGFRTVFMSGFMGDELLRNGIQRERVRFLQKPYSADQLVRAISAAAAADG